MTNKNLTLLAMLLDRSGSMRGIKDDTEGGFNAFIEEQAKQPGQVDVTLAQFDDRFDYVYRNVPISDAPMLKLEPRGMTALLDAIGKLVTEVGAELRARPEHLRPGQVIVVITTDGHENASRKWTVQQVRELITQQQDQWGWTFIFLGANIDAIGTARDFGIPATASMDYGANAAGTQAVYAAASANVSMVRGGQSVNFTAAQREAAMGEPDAKPGAKAKAHAPTVTSK